MSLTREEVSERLAFIQSPFFLGGVDYQANEREALETSLAAMDERDALKGQCQRWEAMYEGMVAERDGCWQDCDRLGAERNTLAAEGRLLRTLCDALMECHETWGKAEPSLLSAAAYALRMSINRVWDWLTIQHSEELEALDNTPLITAEVKRVRRLEEVLEAAESEVLQCAKWTNTDRFDLTACDMCSMRKTCAALKAYREGERPGGEG